MATPSERSKRPAPQQQRRADGLSAGSFLLAALLTCAFGVGVVAAGYFWMAQPEVSEAVTSATSRSDPAAAPLAVDDGSWTDADLRDCKARATTAAEIASKRKLAAVSADRVGLGGPDAGMVERSTYLLCGAARKPLHLCQDYWREWFITALHAHAVEFKQVSTQAYWARFNVGEKARREANQGEWQTISNDLDQTTREVAKMHEEITTAFRSLVSDGIIARDDFGVFLGLGIPTEVRAMLGEARPARNRCG